MATLSALQNPGNRLSNHYRTRVLCPLDLCPEHCPRPFWRRTARLSREMWICILASGDVSSAEVQTCELNQGEMLL
jgi:hypothetical protein